MHSLDATTSNQMQISAIYIKKNILQRVMDVVCMLTTIFNVAPDCIEEIINFCLIYFAIIHQMSGIMQFSCKFFAFALRKKIFNQFFNYISMFSSPVFFSAVRRNDS